MNDDPKAASVLDIVVSTDLLDREQISELVGEHPQATQSTRSVDVRGDTSIWQLSLQLGYPLMVGFLGQLFGHFLAKRRQRAERRQQPFAGTRCCCRIESDQRLHTAERMLVTMNDCVDLANEVGATLQEERSAKVRLLVEADE